MNGTVQLDAGLHKKCQSSARLHNETLWIPKKDQVNLRDAPNFNKLFNILNGLKPNIDLNWRQTMTSNK